MPRLQQTTLAQAVRTCKIVPPWLREITHRLPADAAVLIRLDDSGCVDCVMTEVVDPRFGRMFTLQGSRPGRPQYTQAITR